MVTTTENQSTNDQLGFELIANSNFGKIASANLNGHLYYNTIDVSNLGLGDKKKHDVAWNVSLNGNINITPNLMAQVNLHCKSRILLTQGYARPYFVLNCGAKYDLFHKRMSVICTVSDVFGSNKSVILTDTPYLRARSERSRFSPVAYIGFSYNFGGGTRHKEVSLKYDN